MRLAIAGSVIAASTRIGRPHLQRSASTPNTRFSNSDHGSRRERADRAGLGRGRWVDPGDRFDELACDAGALLSMLRMDTRSGAVISRCGTAVVPASASGERHPPSSRAGHVAIRFVSLSAEAAPGTTRSRPLAQGAKMPWYLTWCARGGGTRGANRSSN